MPSVSAGATLTTASTAPPGGGDRTAIEDLVHEVIEACRRVRDSIEAVEAGLAPILNELREKASLSELLTRERARPGPGVRHEAAEVITQYEQAIARLRSEMVVVLVDHEGHTITAAADAMGISRQLASRLYADGKGAGSPPAGQTPR